MGKVPVKTMNDQKNPAQNINTIKEDMMMSTATRKFLIFHKLKTIQLTIHSVHLPKCVIKFQSLNERYVKSYIPNIDI